MRLYLDNGETEDIQDIYDFADVLDYRLGVDFRKFLLSYIEEQKENLEDVAYQYASIISNLEDNFEEATSESVSSEELSYNLTEIIKTAISEKEESDKVVKQEYGIEL